ncbi:hypothetical protein A2706_05375 [Candidatus Peribacteria bacterium RIFCSPHIGHO2_01_FULL_51_35]|nr:MAG: hypothetical protein A2706_05375 [Candidatus Peribacteria bacterium RIFCSPHIGHO2_01_FULL_51_35]
MADTDPATKGDLKIVQSDLNDLRSEMMDRFDQQHHSLMIMFEQFKHDVLGGFRDFASVQKDKNINHEQRIQHLEKIVGATAA